MENSILNLGSDKINVSERERLISGLTGGVIVLHALLAEKRKPLELVTGGFMLYRAITGYCPARDLVTKAVANHPQNITINTSLTVNKPRAEVYDFWRNIENLPLFMKHLHSVKATSNTTSVWKANIPGGLGTIEWGATIVLDDKNSRIGWKSDEGATIENSGTVHFEGHGESGTEIHVMISYHAPAGIIGEGIARLLNPAFESMVLEDVQNFKQYIETGKNPTMEGPQLE